MTNIRKLGMAILAIVAASGEALAGVLDRMKMAAGHMKRAWWIAIATVALAMMAGAGMAHDGSAGGMRQMWREAKTELRQFFGMRSAGSDSGCSMMGGGTTSGGTMGGGMMGRGMMSGGMMGGGMMGGGTMGGGSMGGAPNEQWRERSVPPPADRRR